MPAGGRAVRLHRLRHVVARRRRARARRPDRGEPRWRTSPTRAASTAGSATCATSWACGCSRSRSGPGSSRARPRTCRRCSIAAGELPAGRPGHRPGRPGRSCRRATCRPGSRPPAARPTSRPPATRPALVRCILDSLAARLRAGGPRRRAAVRPAGRRRPPRRRRGAERAALPAHRRRLRAAGPRRAGRGDRARQRPRPGPGARARWRAISRRSARSSGRPRTSAATSRGRPPPGAEPDADARRAVHHLLQRPAVPGGRAGDGARCCGGSATRSSSRPSRRAAARCTSTPATGTRASRWSSGSSDAFAGYDVVVTPSGSCAAMVRHHHPLVAELAAGAATPALPARVAAVAPRVLRADRVPGRRRSA